MSWFLGIDAGTQSIKGILIDPDGGTLLPPVQVHFGSDLPQYHSPDGFLPNPDRNVVHADPKMWLAALDLLLEKMQRAGMPLSEVQGISGSGQQHGTVYLNDRFLPNLAALDPGKTLAEQLAPAFSRDSAPIWLDGSAAAECEALLTRFGGEIRRRTGSAPAPRFSGPQMMKFARESPASWAKTSRVHLVSSFLASVLAGAEMPIDFGDGAGMNLLNLQTGGWDREIAGFIAPGAIDKLPSAVPSTAVAGKLAPYFAKYSLRPGIPLNVWSGDNPNSLVGCGGAVPGTVVISLGTSDTFFGTMSRPDEASGAFGHVFGNPAGGYMRLLCFNNGSLAREAIRERFHLERPDFEAAARRAAPGRYQLLPHLVPESTPVIANPVLKGNADLNQLSPGELIRAFLESQFLTMRHHAALTRPPRAIRLTGGASASPFLRELAANVFQSPVLIGENSEAAAMGAAMRAANSTGGFSFAMLTEKFCRVRERIDFDPAMKTVYDLALAGFAKLSAD